jgi:N-terminal domain of anti-restriction factor ArdC
LVRRQQGSHPPRLRGYRSGSPERAGQDRRAYTAFWNYSLGNQSLALKQIGRPEPISTFPGWKALGRHVKKGEKAIELIMPLCIKAKNEVTKPKEDDNEGTTGVVKLFAPSGGRR